MGLCLAMRLDTTTVHARQNQFLYSDMRSRLMLGHISILTSISASLLNIRQSVDYFRCENPDILPYRGQLDFSIRFLLEILEDCLPMPIYLSKWLYPDFELF